MRANPLQAIRIGVLNLAAACHFWESAFGFQVVGQTQVDDLVLRKLWEAEGGFLHAARLERPGDPCGRLELYQWEGCSGEPARDPQNPWDPGVRELQFHVADAAKSRWQLERLHCRFPDPDPFVFVTPFGERCRIVDNGAVAAPVVLTVPALAEAREFFETFLGWSCQEEAAATQILCSAGGGGFGRIAVSEYRRFADPRLPVDRAPRMSPRYTGVWMLTASTGQLPAADSRIIRCQVPFVGPTHAIVTRAPGGVRFGVYEA